jgi:hypothetical protein
MILVPLEWFDRHENHHFARLSLFLFDACLPNSQIFLYVCYFSISLLCILFSLSSDMSFFFFLLNFLSDSNETYVCMYVYRQSLFLAMIFFLCLQALPYISGNGLSCIYERKKKKISSHPNH